MWRKELEDGSIAVGLFNLGERAQAITASWSDLGLSAPATIRDLWRQKEVARDRLQYTVDVPPHGVMVVKITSRKH